MPEPTSQEFAAAYDSAERVLVQAAASRIPVRTSRKTRSPPLAPKDRTPATSSAAGTGIDRTDELYYTPEEVVRRWRNRIDIDTLANWRSKRQGPSFHRFGGRVILYRADLLAQWEKKNMIACDPLNVIDREVEPV